MEPGLVRSMLISQISNAISLYLESGDRIEISEKELK